MVAPFGCPCTLCRTSSATAWANLVRICSTLSHPVGAMSTPSTPFLHLLPPERGNAFGQNMSRCRRFGRPNVAQRPRACLGRSRGGNPPFVDSPLPITAQCDRPASSPADRFGVRPGPKTGVRARDGFRAAHGGDRQCPVGTTATYSVLRLTLPNRPNRHRGLFRAGFCGSIAAFHRLPKW